MSLKSAPALASGPEDLQSEILDGIPLARAMGLSVSRWDGRRLQLRAPLAANINDKGCAFGGSLTSLMTLTGWGILWLLLRAEGEDCDIYVQDSEVQYKAPLWTDLIAEAVMPEGFGDCLSALASRGRGRCAVQAHMVGPEGDIARLSARFVAFRRDSSGTPAASA